MRMVSYTKVEREFLNKKLFNSNPLILRKNDALDFITRCNELNISILGFDGYRPHKNHYQIDSEFCRDYEDEGNNFKCFHEVKNFPEIIMIEFVVSNSLKPLI